MSTSTPQDSSLTIALRHFEIAEANLGKLEKIWKDIESIIPSGVSFGNNPEYEDKCRSYAAILPHLPNIDGFKPSTVPDDLNTIGQNRFDAMEVGEISTTVAVEEGVFAPGKELAEYRYKLNRKRRELIRDTLTALIDAIDTDIRLIRENLEKAGGDVSFVSGDAWNDLEKHIGEIDALLGSTKRPPRWSDLHRHLHFAQIGDFDDIESMDWPSVKRGLMENLYEGDEPIPNEVDDLSMLVKSKPTGPVTSKLKWDSLSAEQFERLIFTLISTASGYENPQWLTHTNAPDRGRDLSVSRIFNDSLGGTIRHRVIIQCRHLLARSINATDVATLKEQMKLCEPPRVDVCIVVTSGRFTADAVELIERQNISDLALRIEMWPDSHLEMLLASRPGWIAQFQLR